MGRLSVVRLMVPVVVTVAGRFVAAVAIAEVDAGTMADLVGRPSLLAAPSVYRPPTSWGREVRARSSPDALPEALDSAHRGRSIALSGSP